ncbi:hypothetical protein CHA01nite_31190 [Chryseobacterium hagamense]|uniref:Uncharacterized protein n=1 Tax=Chryseobacterium hagamense TaxID=395935 RepID=A0A511YQB6_9FLAO|nr:hypothetical protein CHA01nite_31190 [Chryseobacterium hagamense]
MVNFALQLKFSYVPTSIKNLNQQVLTGYVCREILNDYNIRQDHVVYFYENKLITDYQPVIFNYF